MGKARPCGEWDTVSWRDAIVWVERTTASLAGSQGDSVLSSLPVTPIGPLDLGCVGGSPFREADTAETAQERGPRILLGYFIRWGERGVIAPLSSHTLPSVGRAGPGTHRLLGLVMGGPVVHSAGFVRCS